MPAFILPVLLLLTPWVFPAAALAETGTVIWDGTPTARPAPAAPRPYVVVPNRPIRPVSAWQPPAPETEAYSNAHGDELWQNSVGLRVVWAQSNFTHDLRDDALVPISKLAFTDSQRTMLELTATAAYLPTNLELRSRLGLGMSDGGNLDNEDYDVNGVYAGYATGVKYSDARQPLKPATLGYAVGDLLWHPEALDWQSRDGGGLRVRVSPLLGLVAWQDHYNSKGAICQADDVGGAICGAQGTVIVPLQDKSVRHRVHWLGVRVGTALDVNLNRLLWRTELAAVPLGYFRNEDSHYIRSELGPTPNFIDTSSGVYGMMMESMLAYQLTPALSVEAGLRYWGLNSGKAETVAAAQLPSAQRPKAGFSYNDVQQTGGWLGLGYSF